MPLKLFALFFIFFFCHLESAKGEDFKDIISKFEFEGEGCPIGPCQCQNFCSEFSFQISHIESKIARLIMDSDNKYDIREAEKSGSCYLMLEKRDYWHYFILGDCYFKREMDSVIGHEIIQLLNSDYVLFSKFKRYERVILPLGSCQIICVISRDCEAYKRLFQQD